jgi:protease I
MRALIISTDLFEDLELLVPYFRLKEENIEVDIASIKRGKIKGIRNYEIEANLSLDEVDPNKYDILILPGGKAPLKIRKEEKALEISRHFFEKDKLVGAICHGPQTLISAGLLKNRHATCYKSVADELKEAGAIYEDKEVVVDGNLVTSRMPTDLPYFLREIMRLIHGK